MQQNLAPTFIATPHGITIDSIPLNKSTSRKLPPETLRYVKRAEELLATVKKEDWDNRTVHATHDVPAIAKAQMMPALASPQHFPLSLNKAGFNPNEPRDERGRWTNGDGVTEADRKNPRFKGMTDTQIKKQKFVDANLAAAEKGAQQLNIPVENLLALSAVESGWGVASRFATDGNNFFGLHYPSPFMNGEPMYAQDNDAPVATFASYEDSMRSFIASQGYIVRNISDSTAFAEALQNSGKFGINPDDGTKVPTYISDIVGTINHLSPYIARTRQTIQ